MWESAAIIEKRVSLHNNSFVYVCVSNLSNTQFYRQHNDRKIYAELSFSECIKWTLHQFHQPILCSFILHWLLGTKIIPPQIIHDSGSVIDIKT